MGEGVVIPAITVNASAEATVTRIPDQKPHRKPATMIAK